MSRTQITPNARKLTDALCKRSTAADGPIIWDTECKGFGLRITENGVRSFVIDYRVNGVQRRMTIGRFGDWTPDGARKYARELKVRVDKGEDPYAKAQGQTVQEAWQRYEREVLPGLSASSKTDYTRYAGVLCDRFGKRRLDAVDTEDIKRLRATYTGKPYAANRLVEFCRVFWNTAIAWKWTAGNPAKGIEPHDEHARETYLNAEEARRVIVALEESPHKDAADLLVFLIATGCRPGEARSATWDQFDLDTGVWLKPAATTKQRKAHRVPLNALAMRVLMNRPKRKLVFAYSDGRPIKRGEKLWRTALRKAEIAKDVPIYAARHSFASIAAAQKLTLQEVGALLGHSQVTTTARYSHLFDDVLRRGTNAVGEAMGHAAR
jgi:integrase